MNAVLTGVLELLLNVFLIISMTIHEHNNNNNNNNNNDNNNNNSLYFQRVTHLAKKKLIFHEVLYELPSKNNTSIKYKDDLHVYEIIQTSWNTFKPTYTQAYFLHKYHIYHTSRYK